MTRKHCFAALIGLIFSLFSCKDQPEQIPAYIQLAPFEVNAPGGIGWQKLPFAWVYINGNPVGAYSPNAVFPVLAEGEVDVVAFPGVSANGIESTPDVYPFLLRYDGKATLVPGQTTLVSPETTYDPGAKSAWGTRGELDGATIVFENLDQDGITSLVFDANGAFSGRSARMAVDTAHTVMAVATEWVTDLPTTGNREIWLEMNYRNDVPFEFYLFGRDANGDAVSQPIYQYQPKSDWNKIYFQLTPFVADLNKQDYRIGFHLELPRDAYGKFTANTGTVQFDNLRLLYFQ